MLLQTPAQASVDGYVEGGYTVGTTTYPLMKGVFHSPSNLPMRFFYTDGFFAEDPYTYNTHLATASLSMAMSGMYADWGAYNERNRNIVQFMKDIKTDNYHHNVYNTVKPTTDSIGVTMGWKKLSDDRILIPISVRGANYEKEWASNVTLGDGKDTNGEAKGFSKSAKLVYDELITYVQSQDKEAFTSDGKLNPNKKLIFWIAGYSRAAAVSNLTAKRLVDLCNGTESKVFAYCFATPRGGWKDTQKKDVNYRCIHNVIDLGDIVPKVAPASMSFMRYGVDHYIPGSEPKQDYVNKKYDYDNDSYYSDPTKYNEALTLMKKHLSAIDTGSKPADPSLLSAKIDTRGLDTSSVKTGIIGTCATYVLNFFNPFRILHTAMFVGGHIWGNYVNKDLEKVFIQSKEKDLTSSFIENFVKYLCEWTELKRETYIGADSSKTYGSVKNVSIEGVLRNLMVIVNDCSESQIEEFKKRISGIVDEVGTKNFILTFYDILPGNKWHKLDASAKSKYIDKFIGWLEDTKCIDALGLTPEKKSKLVNVDLRVLVDFLLSFLSQDYVKNLYGTNGFSQILTLVYNIKAIGQNHSPNVAMAWVRGQDSWYNNETTKVSALYVMPAGENYAVKTSAVKVSTVEEKILVDVGELDDIISKHVQDPLALLATRTSVDVEYADGSVEKRPVKWDETNFDSYYLNRKIPDNPAIWISYDHGSEEPADLAAPMLFVFNGSVDLPDKVTNPYNVNTNFVLSAFVDGLPEKEAPYAFPPDGEYYGSLKVILGCLDDESADIHYALTLKGIWGEDDKYTDPIDIELEEGATEPQDFYLIGYNKSNNPDYADSDVMIWHYTIHPIDPDNAVDENGKFRYTLAKTVTLSKDTAVCWTIKSADVDASRMYAVKTESADTVPTNEVVVTVVTMAGITPAGSYSIPVQISTDGGNTWTDDSTITLNTSELVEDTLKEKEKEKEKEKDEKKNINSSGSGCNASFSVCGLGIALLVVALKRKS